MDMRSYEDWIIHSATESAVDEVTWNQNDLLTLPWSPTYMTDEIPEDSSWDTFATKNKKALEAMYAQWGVPKEGSLHYMSAPYHGHRAAHGACRALSLAVRLRHKHPLQERRGLLCLRKDDVYSWDRPF